MNTTKAERRGLKNDNMLPVGAFVRFNDEPDKIFKRLRAAGFAHCQLAAPPDSYIFGRNGRVMTRKLCDAIEENEITVTSVFMSFPGQIWAREHAHATLGLVPEEFRAERMVRACRIGNWAREIGVDEVVAHAGFIPEDGDGMLYKRFVGAMRLLALFLGSNGQHFNFETGQEKVDVLGRTIKDIGADNLGINFDPANLLIYDMDNPAYLVEKLGQYVMHVHCKDAVRPRQKGGSGEEARLGEGEVEFEKLLHDLYAIGFRGPLTIEREIAPGPEQNRDILQARQLIERIKAKLAQ
ncbi:MAG: sugar phosphate isomerase/epimerase [Kiritimatiellae bacterium]|nr:sugar phosphate isomerase/epimerase [Kiritimatiellia bacterium]